MRRRQAFATFIAIIQVVLLLAHYFLYQTWTFRHVPRHPGWFQTGLGILSVSFVAASVLAFSYTSGPVRALYKAAAVWMGLLSFLFIAALTSWVLFAVASAAGLGMNFHLMVEALFTIAIALGIYGVWNASWTRITRARVKLENLPNAWRGRKAALISDVHLGHVRNRNFLQRLIAKVLLEEPDLIFIAGDLFDGTAIAATGVRVLKNEKVNVDGLQIVGVPYRNATSNGDLAAVLRDLSLDRDRASILLTHAPDHPDVAEAKGFSLQLSGHTHLGQFIPWSWMARRIYRQFVYGLSRIGKM